MKNEKYISKVGLLVTFYMKLWVVIMNDIDRNYQNPLTLTSSSNYITYVTCQMCFFFVNHKNIIIYFSSRIHYEMKEYEGALMFFSHLTFVNELAWNEKHGCLGITK